MELKESYRPANIEFNTDGGSVPMNLGIIFPDQTAANLFIAKNFIAMNTKVRAQRFMDNFEKNEIRKEYQDLLEQKIPLLERELMKAKSAFDEAKKHYADATEYVSASTNEAKALAVEVRRGVTEMELDDMTTWRVPIGDRYYYFTYIDQQIKLCKVQDIPFHERQEIFNAMTKNEEFILMLTGQTPQPNEPDSVDAKPEPNYVDFGEEGDLVNFTEENTEGEYGALPPIDGCITDDEMEAVEKKSKAKKSKKRELKQRSVFSPRE